MSSTFLKLTALVFMLIDHIGHFIPHTPLWFRYIGRLSAPIFIFCAVIGFTHTKDRKRYILNLYFFNILNGILFFIFNLMFSYNGHFTITNNILATLLMIDCCIILIETFNNSKEKFLEYILYFSIYSLISILAVMGICYLIGEGSHTSKIVSQFLFSLLPNILTCEGGDRIIFIGIIFYIARGNKQLLTKLFLLYEGIYLLYVLFLSNFDFSALFTHSYQWMLIFSLPLILMYNGKKGKGLKYLFYIFYPAHIIILFLIGNILY